MIQYEVKLLEIQRYKIYGAPFTKINMIRKILIANRGEIACRVIRTARKMGIKTVSVYSEADRKSMHVQMADEAYLIGPAQSAKSYLDMNKILRVCLDTGVDAVHPGFGFLSENSKFMALLDQNKIIFIGPPARAIEALGDKINSKHIAKKAGVNIVPGFIGEVEDNRESILKIAHSIGYPIMIKASAGGGGKGMRIAWNDDEAVEGYRLSKQEAAASFADDRILMEKFIEEPRHIEFNILGDKHGNIIYLPERECSIQRRNQKVVEEAPSPFLDPETRRKMGEQAVALAKAVNYESTGTMEFMVDKHKGFYFLEMNTRLQVEHPITEEITGLDIVEEMINVANGLPLSKTQDQVKINGHAIESRVYAEDPYRGFLPSIGHLLTYQEPKMPNIRIDTGVREGDEISMYYDPMISKTVSWGKDRAEAIELMKQALDAYVIRGLGHNAPFCRDVLRQPKFVSGEYSTKFIPLTYPEGFKPMPLRNDLKYKLAAFVVAMKQINQEFALEPKTGWHGPYVVKLDDEFYAVTKDDSKLFVTQVDITGKVIGDKLEVDDLELDWDNQKPLIRGRVNKVEHLCQFISHQPLGFNLLFKGHYIKADVLNATQFEFVKYMPAEADATSVKEFLAPMPGAVISVAVKAGDKVNIGQELGILEAMKMRNVLRAERPGTIKKVNVKPGQGVQVDEVIFEFE